MNEHIVKSFDQELQLLDKKIAQMGGLAERQLAQGFDALEVAGHPDRPHYMAQIVGHRLALGDQRDGAVVEFALARVHDGVVGDHTLRQRVVGIQQRLGGTADHRAGEVAHVADQPADLSEILVEGSDCVFGHDPGPRMREISRSGR